MMVFVGAGEGCQKHQSTNQTGVIGKNRKADAIARQIGEQGGKTGDDQSCNATKHVLTLWTADEEAGAGVGVRFEEVEGGRGAALLTGVDVDWDPPAVPEGCASSLR